MSARQQRAAVAAILSYGGAVKYDFDDRSRNPRPALWRARCSGYCHHIERLMILGNFLLLCDIAADDIYQWFMEMFIDAYDWVMVPNVYGMSQYADGGLMTTKPYISGSSYVLNMSDFKRGPWCAVWDAL